MKCCVDCFVDSEIKSIIESHKSLGTCDFCGSTNTHIMDITQPTELEDLFEGLLDIYREIKDLPETYPTALAKPIAQILYEDWYIFQGDSKKILSLITQICKTRFKSYPTFFQNPVGIAELHRPDYLREYSVMGTHTWEFFLEEIKGNNRFHTDMLNTKVLDIFLRPLQKKYSSGHHFYRARIAPTFSGFSSADMGAPPLGQATAGRVNPEGISRLYLASSRKTTFHEIRAAANDYVTVGLFELKKEIEVIDFTMIGKISPFLGIDFTQHAVNLNHLKRIGAEISKPLRRHDSILDYLPTQFITDYIMKKEYSGVEYTSAMDPDGYNLALFDPNVCCCLKTSVFEVDSLDYQYKEL